MEKGCFMLFKIKKRKRNSDKIYGLKQECACNEVLSRNTDTTDSSISIYWYCTPTHMQKPSDPVKPITRGGGEGCVNRLSHECSLAQNEVLRNHPNNIGWLTIFKTDGSHFQIFVPLWEGGCKTKKRRVK